MFVLTCLGVYVMYRIAKRRLFSLVVKHPISEI